MHIDIENIVDQERIFHEVLLISGRIRNAFPEEASQIFVNHEFRDSANSTLSSACLPLRDSRFKFLLRLRKGRNVINFEYKGVLKTLTLIFEEPTEVVKTLRIVYIVPKDSDGTFQGPDHDSNSAELACQKIYLALHLGQCFISDGLHSHGLGRKTFTLKGPCEVFHSDITMEESHALTESSLWEYHARELLSRGLADDNTKVLAVLSATRFVNTLGRVPKDHKEMMSLTKSHGALGGGGLAMFGSGCLYTWPSTLSEVTDAFTDSSPVDSLNYMDDSGYRHTFGACFSTTLGAILHELGHAFDLGHTESGIMARGFDDLLRYYTVQDSVEEVVSTISGSSSVDELSWCQKEILLSPNKESRFTNLRRPSGASYLDAYQQKKELRRMVKDSGKAFWSRSCALILSAHSWFNPGLVSSQSPSLDLSGGILRVRCPGPERVVVLELRKNDRVLGFVEVPSSSGSPRGKEGSTAEVYEFSMGKMIDRYSETNEIVVVTSGGYIWKCVYPLS